MTNASDRSRRMKALFAGMNPADLATLPEASASQQQVKERVSSGAVKSMRGAFSAIEEENERLRQQLESAVNVVELDPELLVPSFIRDRLEEDSSDTFDAFMASIRDHGQQVPILVRPAPEAAGSYQIAYGHRRWRACKALGRPIKAVIQEMTDEALVISQGMENSERQNLSFIEQAFFAKALKKRGYDRQTIAISLGRDEERGLAYISILTSLAESLPEGLVRKIGRAPRSGRPKWERLAKLHASGQLARGKGSSIDALTSSAGWKSADSDERLLMVLQINEEKGQDAAVPSQAGKGQEDALHGITVRRGDRKTTISIDATQLPAFGEWLEARLPDLRDEFERSRKNT